MIDFFVQVVENPRPAIKDLADQPDHGQSIILEALQHSNRNVRLNTVQHLYLAPKFHKIDYILPIMEKVAERIPNDSSVDFQREGLKALQRYCGSFSERDFIHPSVEFALAHQSTSIRSAGLYLLRAVSSDKLLPLLEVVITNEQNEMVRDQAIVVRSFRDKAYTNETLVESVIRICMQDDFYWRELGNRCFNRFNKTEHGEALAHALEHMNLDSQYGQSIKRSIEKSIGSPEEFTPDALIFKLAKIDVSDYTDLKTNWRKVEKAIGDGTASFYKVGHSLYLNSRRQQMEDLYKTVSTLAKTEKIREQIEVDYNHVQARIKQMES